MKQIKTFVLCAVGIVISNCAIASETSSFAYDSRGRLIRVVKTGTVNNGQQTEYQFDKADNRVRVVVTGASVIP